MKVNSISISMYGTPTGTVALRDDSQGVYMSIDLTPEEASQVAALGLRLFQVRQQTLATELANMTAEVPLLAQVSDDKVIDYEF